MHILLAAKKLTLSTILGHTKKMRNWRVRHHSIYHQNSKVQQAYVHKTWETKMKDHIILSCMN